MSFDCTFKEISTIPHLYVECKVNNQIVEGLEACRESQKKNSRKKNAVRTYLLIKRINDIDLLFPDSSI